MSEKPTVELSPFAQAIFARTYAFTPGETWPECARRVAKAVAADSSQEVAFEQLIRDRVFIPGGRYLYSAGRPIFQNANCFGFSVGDSREEWARVLRDAIMCLSMGGGIGCEYSNLRPKDAPIGRMGGKSSGPLALMGMVNEVGRHVFSGGTRRSAIWAGLSWRHPDVHDFIAVKDWDEDTRALKAKRFEAPAPLDMTNVSVVIDNGYLDGLRDGDPAALRLHALVWEHMARTGEPAFRNQALIEEDDRGAITGNPCTPGWTRFLTRRRGWQRLVDLTPVEDEVWTGTTWARLTRVWLTGRKPVLRYRLSNGMIVDLTVDHRVLERGIKVPVGSAKSIDIGPADGDFDGLSISCDPTLAGLVQGDGATTVASGATRKTWLCLGAKDGDIELWLERLGVVGAIVTNKGGRYYVIDASPEDLHVPRRALPQREVDPAWMSASSSVQRAFLLGLFSANGTAHVRGQRARVSLRTSCWAVAEAVQVMLAGLGFRAYLTENRPAMVRWRNGEYLSGPSWDVAIAGHEGCQRFGQEIGFLQKYKMERLAVSRPPSPRARRHNAARVVAAEPIGEHDVYDFTVDAPEHAAVANGLVISNCQEAVLHDRDSCNLGSIVLPRIKNLAHLEAVTRLAIQFLYNGSLRADYPTSEIAAVAARNRRIGLGIMGLHEFMLREGHRYEWFEELGRWLNVWQGAATDEARRYARKCGGPTPITTRAIAPTGTISIIAETTSGIEPVFCSAYKRRYLVGGKHYYRYVVDPTAARFLTNGGGGLVEDAYALAADFERRLEVQAKVQEYVDQAISSTVNLPAWGEPGNDDPAGMATTVARYLPRLKGLTCYPNGSRPGQPITPVDPEMALREADVVFEEEGECRTGVCGL